MGSELPVVRNGRFYIDTVIFQVENELFKVKRDLLTNSSHVFRDMFALPQSNGKSTQGLVDWDPIVLQSVQKGTFENLLTILEQNSDICEEAPSPKMVLDLEKWVSLLKLTRMWAMEATHKIIHEEISQHEYWGDQPETKIKEKLALARQYYLVDLFLLASKEYVQRSSPILQAEAQEIGLNRAFELIALREARRDRLFAQIPEMLEKRSTSTSGDTLIWLSVRLANDIMIATDVQDRFAAEIQDLQTEYDNLFVTTD